MWKLNYTKKWKLKRFIYLGTQIRNFNTEGTNKRIKSFISKNGRSKKRNRKRLNTKKGKNM